MRRTPFFLLAVALTLTVMGSTALAGTTVRCGERFNCFGTDGPDLMVGNAENNAMTAHEKSDTLKGRGGEDGLYGDEGNDVLLGGNRDDTLEGGPGGDTLVGGPGNDAYDFYGDAWGRDFIHDTSVPGTTAETENHVYVGIWKSRQNVTITLDSGSGPEISSAGGATANWEGDAVENASIFNAGPENRILGNGVANLLSVWGGRDTVEGGGGDDRIYADDGSGDDTISCGEDEDGQDNDVVFRDPPDPATGDPGDTVSDDCEVQKDPIQFELEGEASRTGR